MNAKTGKIDTYSYIIKATEAELNLDTRSTLGLFTRSHITKLMIADLNQIDKLLQTVQYPKKFENSP